MGEDPVEQLCGLLGGRVVGEEGGLVLHRHGGERRRGEQPQHRGQQPRGDDQEGSRQPAAAAARVVGSRHRVHPRLSEP